MDQNRERLHLVDIFGKKKLEERLAELEAEREKLERENEELGETLERREEKIRRLASANQEANLALKALEQKARRAEEAVTATVAAGDAARPTADGADRSDSKHNKPPRAWKLTSRELDMLLERLKGIHSPREDLLVAAFPGSMPAEAGVAPHIIESAMAVKSSRGRIIVYSPQLFLLQLIPPIPLKEGASWEGGSFRLDLIEEMMNTPTLVISAHAGETFLGVALSRASFEVKELVESQVKEKHSKGGWSQKRFERLREEDIKNHIDAVEEALSRLMERYGSIVQYAILGGEESLVRQIRPSINLPVVERRLEQHDEKDLEALLEEVYGFTCYRIEI